MARIRNIGWIPVVLIPVLIYCLIFERQEKDFIFSISLLLFGVVLYKILKFAAVGIILMMLGFAFFFFLDENYDRNVFGFITVRTNPFFIKNWNRFKAYLAMLFRPLTEYKHFHIISELFYWAYTVLWCLILIYTILWCFVFVMLRISDKNSGKEVRFL